MSKYISKILIVLGIITFSFVGASSVSASSPSLERCLNPGWTIPIGCDQVLNTYYSGYYNNGGYNNYNQPSQYNNQYSNSQYGTSGTPIVYNYYYQSSPTTTKSTTSSTVKSSTASSTTAKSNTSDTNKADITTDGSDVFSTTSHSNGLTALSFRGSGGFLPSSFWQWLLVIVLILIIVIIARMIGRSHRTEIHTIPAH